MKPHHYHYHHHPLCTTTSNSTPTTGRRCWRKSAAAAVRRRRLTGRSVRVALATVAASAATPAATRTSWPRPAPQPSPAVAAVARSPNDGTCALPTGPGTADASGAATAGCRSLPSWPASHAMGTSTARRIIIGEGGLGDGLCFESNNSWSKRFYRSTCKSLSSKLELQTRLV